MARDFFLFICWNMTHLSFFFFFKILLVGGADQYLGSSSDPMLALATQRRLSIATWNIAAINNNVRIKYSTIFYLYISY